ncbi:MAG: DUF6599 family protein [Candidatus Sulfotelmatobacter sp.]
MFVLVSCVSIASLEFGAVTAFAQSSDISQKQIQTFLSVPLPGKLTPEEAATYYKADSLYQYIDGGADVYLLYDFRVLLHQELKSASSEVTADVYDMGKREDAFGIYAAERSPKYKFVSIGIEGYRSKGILNFVQDHYYLKLQADGAKADPLLDPLARALSQRIGGVRTAPALLLKLPRENKIERSEQYVRKDPLGHSFLAPSYIAAYTWGAQEGKVIISVADDPVGAKARLDQLVKHFQQSGTCSEAKDLGAGGIRAKNSFEGNWIAKTQGRYLIALVNPPENGAGILNRTAQGLR